MTNADSTDEITEPLTYDHMAIVRDARGSQIADCAIIPAWDGFTPTQEQEVAVARRFCAAVNACRGQSTDALEQGIFRPAVQDLDGLLTKIATAHLGIATLSTRRSDALDFHCVAVWQVKAALTAAFEAGAKTALGGPGGRTRKRQSD